MNSLDSRALRLGDCFAQQFPTPGQIRYFVGTGTLFPGVHTRASEVEGLLIEVKPKSPGAAAAKQYNVVVKTSGNALAVDPERLSIEAGDAVLWYTADPAVAGFVVAGEGPNFRFDSARITNGAIYTHAFGSPGRHEWVDANGGPVSGAVDVRPVDVKTAEDRDRWYEILKKPAAFEIKGDKATPAAVEITVGQTVFWSVTGSAGIGITDARLVRSQK